MFSAVIYAASAAAIATAASGGCGGLVIGVAMIAFAAGLVIGALASFGAIFAWAMTITDEPPCD